MGFDVLARWYDLMEAALAQGRLRRARLRFLAETGPVKRAAFLGEGTGKTLSEFLKLQPEAHATVVDASAKMLDRARARIAGREDRVAFVHADALVWAPPVQVFDLVVTPFFLDCFRPEQLASLAPRLAASLRPGGVWLVSDFAVPDAPGWRRTRARVIVGLMYGFFRLTTGIQASRLTPHGPLLEAAGLEKRAADSWEWGMIVSELWRNARGAHLSFDRKQAFV